MVLQLNRLRFGRLLPATATPVTSAKRDRGSICRTQKSGGHATAVQQQRTLFFSSEEIIQTLPVDGSAAQLGPFVPHSQAGLAAIDIISWY